MSDIRMGEAESRFAEIIWNNEPLSSGQICLETDLIYVDGLFYDYGPGHNEEGNRNAILFMLQQFGLDDWPGWMYEWYADTGWTLQPPAMFARYP